MRDQIEISLTISVLRVTRLESIGEDNLPYGSVVKVSDFSLADTRSLALGPPTIGKKGLTTDSLEVALEAGDKRPLFNAIVRFKRSSPRPRNLVVSSTISLLIVGSYCRLAWGMDGGARKLPQNDCRLQS
jgi:hypothetical protein